MRENDIFTVHLRLWLNHNEQFRRLLLLKCNIEPEPHITKKGMIVGTILLSEEDELSEVKEFIQRESIQTDDFDICLGLLTDFDESFIDIPDWVIRHYIYLECKRMLFNYTTRVYYSK